MAEQSYDDVIADAERRGLKPDASYLAPKYDYIRLTARAMNLKLGETAVLTFEANGEVQPGTFIIKCVSEAPATRTIMAATSTESDSSMTFRYDITVVEQASRRQQGTPKRPRPR